MRKVKKKKTPSLRNHYGLFKINALLSMPKNMVAKDSCELMEDARWHATIFIRLILGFPDEHPIH